MQITNNIHEIHSILHGATGKKKKNYKEYMEGVVSNIVAKSLHGEGDV